MTYLDIQAEGAIAAITFRQDGKHVVGSTGLGSVRKWDTTNAREVGRVMPVGVEAGAVAASRDGVWIVGGTTTGSVIVWKGTKHEKVLEVKSAHADWVLSVDISPDCRTFATGSYDETAVAWDLVTGDKVFEPIKHPAHVGTVRFSPTGDRLATATWGDLSIRIFDSRSGELITRIPNAVVSAHPNTLAWADDGQRLFTPYEVSINQFDVATSKLISSWKVDPYIAVQNTCVAKNGQFIACSIDRVVAFWDTLTHTTICPSLRLTSRLKSVTISPDDTRLAFGQYDDKISLHNLRDILPHSYFVARNTPVLVSEKSLWNLYRHSRNDLVPLMYVVGQAFEPWIRGKLGNAESVFTQEIIRSSNRDHHAFANRALIRTRSKQFKEAIDDAEKSMKIQPSAIALIAKGMALIGDKRASDGYRACDLAIAHNPISNDFLRVIKSIIYCITENTEDAISPVNDKIRAMDDKPMSYFVQAQLYFLFGSQQLSRGEYERAVQSFTHAQHPIQPLESPYLTTISLVFNWNFQDLHFDTQRGLCEALCGAERPKEAIETLQKMKDCFGEDTRPTQSTVEWVADFTRRCVLALERTGDTAFSTSDHETAIIHYALVVLFTQPCPKATLRKWVKAKLMNGCSWKEVLRASVELKLSKFIIYQAICEVLAEYEPERLAEATECFYTMTNDIEWETIVDDENHHWVLAFKHRCGDVAMKLQQYDAAIDHYSVAVLHQPQKPDALIKRSKAQAAKELWDDALQDMDEAMKLDSSSPQCYEAKHAVLCDAQRYDEAIDVFNNMLIMIEQSTNPAVGELRNNYVSPSEAMAAVDNVAFDIQKNCPSVLIDVTTGFLCNESERMRIFKDGPTFKSLVASMTTKLDKDKIRNVVGDFLKFVMLSHVWSKPEEGKEPTFQDVNEFKSVWELPNTPQSEKLQNFCKKTRNLDYRWAWSDTCCIDKSTNAILDRSLTSMYRWYANSAATLALLVDLDYPSISGGLLRSWWMTRAWTLQELLAPKVIVFYDAAWKPYLGDARKNHKDSPEIVKELAEAIQVSSETIHTFHPEDLSVREKLRLASCRNATVEEDIAYSLIGIFKSDIRPHYGEGGADALGHLLEEIVTRSGEITVLEWIGKSSPYNSCLPASISVYSRASHIPEALGGEKLEESAVRLKEVLSRDVAVEFYDLADNLPDANFSHRRLSLPCVIFRAGSLSVQELRHGSEKVYSAEFSGLPEVIELTTADILPLREPRELILVHPFINRIRGPRSTANRKQEGGMNVAPVPPVPLPAVTGPQIDEYTRAIHLIARIEQPFCALLLLQQSDGKYKRVAAEYEVIVAPHIASLKDIRVDTLQVL